MTSFRVPAVHVLTPAKSGLVVCHSFSHEAGQCRIALHAARSFAVLAPGNGPAATAVPASTKRRAAIKAPRRMSGRYTSNWMIRVIALALVVLVAAGCGGTRS